MIKIFDDPENYELQIRYVRVDRQSGGSAKLTPFEYRVDTSTYFYPASTVKMPVAFLALEKLNELKEVGIDANTTLKIDAPRNPPQSPVDADSTALDNRATIGHYVHKLFTVSDNDAYNRLYEFVGPEEINSKLRDKRIFRNSRIVHRVGISGFNTEEHLHTNPFRFYDGKELLYEQPAKYMKPWDFEELGRTMKGVAYKDNEGDVIQEPFDFSKKNFVSLRDLQESLMSVILKDGKFNLSDSDYDLLYRSLSILPRESKAPLYEFPEYYDSYVKFFMFGEAKDDIPDHIRIFNKVGFAYGYLTDCAYIVDFKNDVEFFLAATIHVNENKTYNDGIYEYDDVGIPFLSRLGRKFYEYERSRTKIHKHDMIQYMLKY